MQIVPRPHVLHLGFYSCNPLSILPAFSALPVEADYMADSATLLIGVAFLIVATLPVGILAFLWAISAPDRSPKWVYLGSKWTTIVLFVPWLFVTVGVVSDFVRN
jgi:hypothetical protein